MGAAAPFALLSGYLAYERVAHETSVVTEMVGRHTQATAADAYEVVRDTRLMLDELAARPAVAALDAENCDTLLGDLLRLNPQFANIFTLDASGRTLCSATTLSPVAPARVDPRLYMNAVKATKAFTLGAPAKGVVTGKWVVSAVRPILAGREVRGVVGASLDLVGLASLINRSALHPDAIVEILDPGGTILTRYPDPQAFAGRDVTASPAARIALQAKSGTVLGSGLLGVERLWAFMPVRDTNWIVLSGIPTEAILAPVRYATMWISALVVAGIAFAILLSIGIARPIARPIAAIAAAARRMSSETSVEQLEPTGPAEIAALAEDLNRMLARRVAADRHLLDSEDRLSESRQRLEGIVASAMDAIVTVDSTQRITLFNPAAERMFGVPAAEVHGRSLDCLIPEPLRARHAGHVARFGKTGDTSRAMGALGTVHGLRANGERFPLEAAISHVTVGGQKFYTAILRDIADRMRAEKALSDLNASLERRVAERTADLEAAIRELEAFDYSISHDIRAPLNRIRGFSDALLAEFGGQLAPEARNLLERIRASGESLERLVADMLSLSTIARGEIHRSDVNLSGLAHAILESLQRVEPGRHVQAVVAADVNAYADPGLMRIVLDNLLGNAWKFSGRRETARIEFGCDGDSGAPRYFVRDDGAGFDPAMAEKLFAPFRRLHSKSEFPGTGIGLATVQRIVHRHGGRIWAHGAVGAGATFYFTLSN